MQVLDSLNGSLDHADELVNLANLKLGNVGHELMSTGVSSSSPRRI